MSFLLFLSLLFTITLVYTWFTLNTRYKSFDGYLLTLVTYAVFVYLDFKYILVGLS